MKSNQREPYVDLTVLGAVYQYPANHPEYPNQYRRMPGTIDLIFIGLATLSETGIWGPTERAPDQE